MAAVARSRLLYSMHLVRNEAEKQLQTRQTLDCNVLLAAAESSPTITLFLGNLNTSLVRRCSSVCTDRYLGTSYIDSFIPASDATPRRRCLRSANRNCLTVPHCRLSSARTAVGRSTTLARQSGTCCQMILQIRATWIVLSGP